jgi:methionine-rich copper-binding protein CopC
MSARIVRAALAVALCLLAARAAYAHAHLDRAEPAAGSTVTQAPTEVALWFTEALEPKFSGVEVRDAKGLAVQAGPAGLAGRAALRVPLNALAPGNYKVIWHVMSVDTHRTQGTFTFTVGR